MGEDSHVSLENLRIEIPGDNHTYQTRASTKRILDTAPSMILSLKRNTFILWYSFSKLSLHFGLEPV